MGGTDKAQMMQTNPPQFPVGPFSPPDRVTDDMRRNWIADLELLPKQLHHALEGLTESQLDRKIS